MAVKSDRPGGVLRWRKSRHQRKGSDTSHSIWRISLYFLLALALALIPFTPEGEALAAPKSPKATGTIAYVNANSTKLHLIQPDGSNDHVIWTAPIVGNVQSGVRFPAWRPDGTEIAFASDFEQTVSLLQSDIFAVKPDGSGLRKITDPPLNSQLSSFQTGTVTVHITNENVSDSLFIIYVQGAQAPQSTTVLAGTTKNLTFTNVAIFPGQSQFPVAINGITRWYGQPDTTTFQAGTNNSATIDINTGGYDDFGGSMPVWRSDSQEVGYWIGQACIGQTIAASPAPGEQWGEQIVGYSASMCDFDRGPTVATADQVIYWDSLGNFPDGAFIQATEGASSGTMLFDTGYGGYVYGLRWAPDGGSILYSFNDGSCDCSNLYEYNLFSKNLTQITHFTQEYVGSFTISPDGQKIVFEHFDIDPNPTLNPDAVPDLWMTDRNGSGAALFLQKARDPAWGTPSSTPPPPPPTQNELFLPLLEKH